MSTPYGSAPPGYRAPRFGTGVGAPGIHSLSLPPIDEPGTVELVAEVSLYQARMDSLSAALVFHAGQDDATAGDVIETSNVFYGYLIADGT